MRLIALQFGAFAIWAAAGQIQPQLPLSLAFAICDVIGHVASAVFVAGWLVPMCGWRTLLAAMLGATVIDFDHAVAARSLDAAQMMALGARPPTHSLMAAVGAAALGGLFGGVRVGYGVLIGCLMHILGDATGEPGVPLLFPFRSDAHVMLPLWLVVAIMGAWACVHVLISDPAANRARLRFSRGRRLIGRA